jgi:hypothetical protein
MREAVLEEWAARCTSAKVRNPARYLFGLIQRALRGEFNARRQPSDAATSRSNGLTSDQPFDRSTPATSVHDHIEALRQLLRIP